SPRQCYYAASIEGGLGRWTGTDSVSGICCDATAWLPALLKRSSASGRGSVHVGCPTWSVAPVRHRTALPCCRSPPHWDRAMPSATHCSLAAVDYVSHP